MLRYTTVQYAQPGNGRLIWTLLCNHVRLLVRVCSLFPQSCLHWLRYDHTPYLLHPLLTIPVVHRLIIVIKLLTHSFQYTRSARFVLLRPISNSNMSIGDSQLKRLMKIAACRGTTATRDEALSCVDERSHHQAPRASIAWDSLARIARLQDVR
jgi:hypothetical protein